MDDALVVGLLERLGDLPGDLERLVERDGAPREALLEVLALDQLEGEEGLAVGFLEPVDGGDVRVVERGEQMRLALEAPQAVGVLGHLRRQDLDRDVAVEVRVGRAVDLAHPAGAERRGDPVVRQRPADQRSLPWTGADYEAPRAPDYRPTRPSLLGQHLARVDARGAARGQRAGDERHEREQQRDAGDDAQVGGLDAEQLALEAAAQQRTRPRRRAAKPDAEQQQALAQHQVEDRRGRCCRARCRMPISRLRCVTR